MSNRSVLLSIFRNYVINYVRAACTELVVIMLCEVSLLADDVDAIIADRRTPSAVGRRSALRAFGFVALLCSFFLLRSCWCCYATLCPACFLHCLYCCNDGSSVWDASLKE